MFKKQLMADCRQIFGIKKIIFGDVDQGEEQNALYISIEDCKEVFHTGTVDFMVRGTLGMLGTKESTPYGFFLDRLKQAFKNSKINIAAQRFLIYGKEKDVKFSSYEGFFIQSEVSFFYKVTLEYDPAKKTRGFIAKIKEVLR